MREGRVRRLVVAAVICFIQAEDGIRDTSVTGAQTCALPIFETKKPYVILRKTYKPYMGDALKAETLSITTGQPQVLILDEKDRQVIQGKKVVILDDGIST